jgi:hypothetical protein
MTKLFAVAAILASIALPTFAQAYTFNSPRVYNPYVPASRFSTPTIYHPRAMNPYGYR